MSDLIQVGNSLANPQTEPDLSQVADNLTTIIVTIDGREFTVAATETEARVRDTLSQTYPGARDAQLTKESRIIDGQRYPVWVFTKRGGTKGADAALELAALLASCPPIPIGVVRRSGAVAEELRGALTFDDLMHDVPVNEEGEIEIITTGDALCEQLIALPAVVATSLDD